LKKQQKPWWCGAATLQNAYRFYGDKVSQKSIAEHIGLDLNTDTDVEDTTEGIKRAVLANGYSYDELSTDVWNDAMNWLNTRVLQACEPVMLCIDNWSHWVVLLGAAGVAGHTKWIIFDPGNYEWLKAEQGIRVWDNKKLLKHWRASWKTGRDPEEYKGCKPYYALAVVK
jgi:ABC-type bacteriocin/lantibiotic exporter with double-glycine peptidase domain